MKRSERLKTRKLTNHLFIIFLWNFSILIYFELLTRFITAGPSSAFLSSGLFHSFLFSLAITSFVVAIIYLFPEKYHYILSHIWMILLAIIFISQIIYHDIFRTFYYFKSFLQAQQGFGFKTVIQSALTRNIWWVLLSFSIIAFAIYSGIRKNKRYKTNTPNWPTKAIVVGSLLATCIIIHFLTISIVRLDEQAKDSYFNSNTTNVSVQKLGVLTTVRIDIQRSLTNWSPTLAVTAPEENELEEEPDHIEEPTEKPETPENPNNNSDPIEEIPEPVHYDDNKLNIPFDKLINETKNDELKQMHQYFNQKKPSKQNEFTGKYEGYNLIWITAEGFAPYAIDKNLTPTLYKLSTEGYQFTNYYNPIWGVSTSDGEYTILHSLVPKAGVWSFSKSAKNDLPFAMGNQLKKAGYTTKAYHNHSYQYYDRHLSHPNMGYEYKGIGNGLNISGGWPRSDLEMMQVTIGEYIDAEPFHAYYMTVSGHLEYSFTGNNIAHKNRKLVEHLDLSNEAKAYLATQIEFDLAMKEILNRLEKANVDQRTLIVITGDHYPYGLNNKTIAELTGKPVDTKFGLYENEWILYAPNMKDEAVVIEEPTYTLDILPTVSNLMGVDFDSRLFMGRDVFSDTEPFVVFEDKSFITKKIKYYYPNNEITLLSDETVSDDYVQKMKTKVDEIFYYSTKILDLNYYGKLEWNN